MKIFRPFRAYQRQSSLIQNNIRMFAKEKEQTSVVYENPYTLEVIGEEPYLSSDQVEAKVKIAHQAGLENKD